MKPFERELKAVLARREPSEDFTARVMADPEGKEFCLVHLGSSAPGA